MLILDASGQVYSVGSCSYGTLGLGSTTEVSKPTPVSALSGIRITRVAHGGRQAMALSEDGEVFTWGSGGSITRACGLGHGNEVAQPEPALVEWFADAGITLASADTGERHGTAVSNDGQVYTWGDGQLGRLGNGIANQPLPEPVEVLDDMQVRSVHAGKAFCVALTEGGSIWGWGKNDQSQLGLGPRMVMDMNTMEEYPVEIEGVRGRIAQVAAGDMHCVALRDDGEVLYWGSGGFLEPSAKAAFSQDDPVFRVCAGEGVSAAITQSGQLWTWGRNLMTGTLGVEQRTGSTQPVLVQALADEGVGVSDASFGAKCAAAVVGKPAAPRSIDTPDAGGDQEGGFLAGLFG